MTCYRVHEIDAASRNLNDLLDVACQIQFETAPGSEDRRIDSLLWIARDLSNGIVAKLDKESEVAPPAPSKRRKETSE